ncbi:MAG: ankyrin repeat domain-containing protein [Actinomycetota bacterium]|nr:ankyrin repeat domain-containing protein [Actinomycetota bacterium]
MTAFIRCGALFATAALVVGACGPVGSPKRTPAPTETAPVTPSQTPKENPFVNLDQKTLDTRLIAAAWANDVPKARKLIEAGADVNAKDDTVQSAYLIATSEGHLSLLELTLRHGAKVKSLDSWDGTGLIRASERGHAHVVGRLLRAGVDPNHVNNLGWVGLHEALVFAKAEKPRQYEDTVRVLVAGGADVSIRSRKDSATPIELAERRGLRAQSRLLRAAAKPRTISSADADRDLLRAAEKGDADAAALALRAGADLESRNDQRQTPLLLAAANDRYAVARLLVDLGADPDALDARHDTPWLVTGVTGSVAMLETLLPAHPDLTIKNRYGGLSPIPAGERGHADYIRRVVSTDVNLNHVNDLGWTALLETVILGDGSKPYQDIVETLVRAGVDTSIKDKNGRTALDHAKSKGYTNIVRALENG